MNKERTKIERIKYARKKIEECGYKIKKQNKAKIQFKFKGCTIYFFPYSGWASGKTIKDCRGLNKLIEQIKQ